MLKVLHVSDTHIGTQYGSDKRRQDYKDSFMETIDIADEKDVDLIIHSGDLFDSPNPNIKEFNDCIDIFNKAMEKNMKIKGIVGNHERKRDKQWLDIYKKFDMCERLSKKPEVIEKQDVKVAFYGIDSIRKPWWDNKNLKLEDVDADYKVLVMHELINPPVPEHMADYNVEEVLEKIGIDIDMLLLGDYHEKSLAKHGNTKIIYPGSTEKTSINESKDHFVYLYEFGQDSVNEKQIKLESPRPILDINLTLKQEDNLQNVISEINSVDLYRQNNKKPILYISLEGTNNRINVNEIREEYDNKYEIIRIKNNLNNPEIDENFDEKNIEDGNIEEEIQERIKEEKLSNGTLKLKEIAIDEETPKSNVREEIRKNIKGDNNEN